MDKTQLLHEIDKVLSDSHITSLSKLASINTLTASYLSKGVSAYSSFNKPLKTSVWASPTYQAYAPAFKVSPTLEDKLPPDYKHLAEKAIFVRSILLDTKDMTNCPVCVVPLFPYDKIGGGGKCWQCKVYFLAKDATIEDLIKTRKSHNKPIGDLFGISGPVFMWREHVDEEDGEIVDIIEPLELTDSTASKDLPW